MSLIDDGFSLDDLEGFDLEPKEPSLRYTIKLNRDSEYFSTPWQDLYGTVVEIEVEKDGKHRFKVVNIIDTYDLKNEMQRKLVVVEI